MSNSYYKQWSPADRNRSYLLTQKAKKKKLIDSPEYCNRCGQDKGIIHSHNEDYGFTLEVLPDILSGKVVPDEKLRLRLLDCLESLCWRCHMILHSEKRDKEACGRYWNQIATGKIFPPVYKHDFSILYKDHGIGAGGKLFT
jgi:hypothetical protein